MKKIKPILLIILVAMLFGCNYYGLTEDELTEIAFQRMIGGHEIYYTNFGDFSTDKPIEQKIFDIVTVMRQNIEYRITPDEEFILPNPKDIWERGYADCDGFAIVLMNILYVELGIRSQFLATDMVSTRAIVNGGPVTHGTIYLDGKVYEAQTGLQTYYTVNYLYPFELVFSADF